MKVYPQRGATDSASIELPCSAQQAYDYISDISHIPHWSPECYKTEWLDGATRTATGARFKGYNEERIKWATVCVVEVAEPDKEFCFKVESGVGRAQTRWRFILEPLDDTHCKLTESWEIVRANPWIIRRITMAKRHDNERTRPLKLRKNMQASLENIRALLTTSS